MKKLCILALTYKTFPAPVPRVHQATVDVLTQMDLKVHPPTTAAGWKRPRSG